LSDPANLSDPDLPGLSLALDRDAFLGLLADKFPECRDNPRDDARIVDVQYVRGRSAHVLWKLSARDSETARTGRQFVFAKALRRDDPAPAEPVDLVRRYREMRARNDMTGAMPLSTPWLFIPGAQLIVHAFPLDPVLPSLIDAADPPAMKEALHRIWQPQRLRVRRVRIETLSYTPEQRAALEYEVFVEDKDTGAPRSRRLVGKLDVRGSPARQFAGHWAVWRRTLGRVSIAPPAGYLAVMGLTLQEFVSGVRLSDIAGAGAFLDQMRAAARAIAVVHSLNLPMRSERGLEKEMGVVKRWIGLLTGLRPARAKSLRRLGERLHSELAERMRMTATVHADFHLANVLADGDRVTIIDWDQVARGDPMIDVGRVLASLRVSSMRVNGTLAGLAGAEEVFLEAYLDQTKDDERRARLFEAVSLLVAAAAPFRLQRQGWEASADLMLDEAERTLQLSLNGPRLVSAAGQQKRELPFSERADWALDPPYAQALLTPIVQEAYGTDIEITETLAELVEHGDSRLQVRWSLKGYKGKERWASQLEGLGFCDDSGRGRLRRFTICGEALRLHPNALGIPRALGHLGPLALQVLKAPGGRPLLSLIGGADEAAAIGATAHALAEFHGLKLDLGKERETNRDVSAIGRRVQRLQATGHPQARAALEIFAQLTPSLAEIGERRAPTLKGLSLRELCVEGTGAGAALVHDVLLAEPLLAAGDLTAQLFAHALEQGVAASAAEKFHEAYLRASRESEQALALFEALALLWRACRRGMKDVADPLPAQLLAAAGARVGTFVAP